MPDLDAAIRAKLASWGDDPCGYATCIVFGWAETRAAIEAVLDLHRPVSNEAWTSSTPSIVCSCSPGEDDHFDEPYPGRELRAIAERLGVEIVDE